WRIIARNGIDDLSMRELASEAGYANGAIGHYFSGKDEILSVAYEHVVAMTDERISRSVDGYKGFDALRRMCMEIMPMTEETRLESRVVVSFWQRSLNDLRLANINDAAVKKWRNQLCSYWLEGTRRSDHSTINIESRVDALMTMLVGLQVSCALGGHESYTPNTQLSMLDTFLP